MVRTRFSLLVTLLFGLLFGAATPVFAQDGTGGLTLDTAYPSMVVGIGETVAVNMELRSSISETVSLTVTGLPKDWTAEFRGGGRVIGSAYVAQGAPSKVELRVTTPTTAKAGTYDFKVVAQSQNEKTEFPV